MQRKRGKEEGKKFDKIVLSQNRETSHPPICYDRRVTKDQQDSHCWLLAVTHCLRSQIRVFGCLLF